MDINLKAKCFVPATLFAQPSRSSVLLRERQTGSMLTKTCSVKSTQSIIWIVSVIWLALLLHVPGVIVGHGQWWCAGVNGGGRGADFCRVRQQTLLVVVVKLADNNAAEVLIVLGTVVKELTDLGSARGLVYDQFVIFPHQHGAGQQCVQALVQTGLCHLQDDVLTPCCDPLGDWTL